MVQPALLEDALSGEALNKTHWSLRVRRHYVVRFVFLIVVCTGLGHAQQPSRNPNLNASINPNLNASINPNLNASINPNLNAAINPNLNAAINPNFSRNVPGYYLWSTGGKSIGFIAIVNQSFAVMFSEGQWRGFFATNGIGGFNYFSQQGKWLGYLVKNSQGGFNLFHTDGSWLGFTT